MFVIANCEGVNTEEKIKENCYISGGHLKTFGYWLFALFNAVVWKIIELKAQV